MKYFISNSVLASGLILLSVADYRQTPIPSVPYTTTAPGTYIFAKKLTVLNDASCALIEPDSVLRILPKSNTLYNITEIVVRTRKTSFRTS